MRQIKFRGWCTRKKKMYSPETMGKDQLTISPDGRGFINVHGDSTKLSQYYEYILPMQFTGLHDKKRTNEFSIGQEIYGDDIYKDADGIISVVKMAVDGWALFPIQKGIPVRNLYWHNICNETNGEVIGSIHENPELIEKESEQSRTGSV
jgi:uncharacterized phage protein (TIGR01671 family)